MARRGVIIPEIALSSRHYYRVLTENKKKTPQTQLRRKM